MTTKVIWRVLVIITQICLHKLLFVYWPLLEILLNTCLTSSLPATIKNITLKCSQLIVKLICPNKHENTWKSQLGVTQCSKGNLIISAAVLCSRNMFEKIAWYFSIANIQWITKTNYYVIQKKFLAGDVDLNYFHMNASLVSRLNILKGSVRYVETEDMVILGIKKNVTHSLTHFSPVSHFYTP